MNGETIRFPVAGMSCVSCVSRITRAIRRIDGVTAVHVDLRSETATVRREPALVSNAVLAAAVAEAGYAADLDAAAVLPAPATDPAPRGRLGGMLRLVRSRRSRSTPGA